MSGPLFLLFGHGHCHIAAIFDYMSNRFQACFQAGNTDSRWPHVDAATRLPEIERNTDHANLFRRDAAEGRVRSRGHESFRFRVSRMRTSTTHRDQESI